MNIQNRAWFWVTVFRRWEGRGGEGRKEKREKKGEGKGRGKTVTDLEDSSGSRGKDCQVEITRFNSVLRVTQDLCIALPGPCLIWPTFHRIPLPSSLFCSKCAGLLFLAYTHFLPLTPRPLLYCALCFNSFPLLFRLNPPTQPLLSALVIFPWEVLHDFFVQVITPLYTLVLPWPLS